MIDATVAKSLGYLGCTYLRVGNGLTERVKEMHKPVYLVDPVIELQVVHGISNVIT